MDQLMENEEYVCSICKKSFYNQKALKCHFLYTHPDNGSSTPEDDTVAKESSSFVKPIQFIPYDGDNLEEISYINVEILETVKRGSMHREATKIMKSKTPIDFRGPFTCTYTDCSQIFFNCCQYSIHYRDEHTKRRKTTLRCQICEKRLDCDVSRGTTNMYPCKACKYIFLNSQEFDEHNRSFHAKVKPFKCLLCPKSFTQHGGLQQHMRMHAGIRPFACQYCTKSFTQRAGLDQHIRTHTKVKPFICIVCRKGFSQSVHLRQHMRTHTNIQPFKCPICTRGFKQRSHLNFHLRTHPKEAVAEYFNTNVMNQGEASDNFAIPSNLNNNWPELTAIPANNRGGLNELTPIQDGNALYYKVEFFPE